MRVILTTLVFVAGLLVLSLAFAIFDNPTAATASWQGALLALAIGAVAFGLRFVPDGPLGLDRMSGTAYDDPDSFWGRFDRFYRG